MRARRASPLWRCPAPRCSTSGSHDEEAAEQRQARDAARGHDPHSGVGEGRGGGAGVRGSVALPPGDAGRRGGGAGGRGAAGDARHALTPHAPRAPLLTLRNKHGRGHVKRVRCESSGAMVPKDKAIKRFIVRNMVDASAIRDLQDSCVIDGEAGGAGGQALGGRRPARERAHGAPLAPLRRCACARPEARAASACRLELGNKVPASQHA